MTLHLIDLYNFKPPAELSVNREESQAMRLNAAKTSLVRCAATPEMHMCLHKCSKRPTSSTAMHCVLVCGLESQLINWSVLAMHVHLQHALLQHSCGH